MAGHACRGRTRRGQSRAARLPVHRPRETGSDHSADPQRAEESPNYSGVVGALPLTATLIWVEGFQALDPERPPESAAVPFPPAAAIIAADLPNEESTVVETVEAFLWLEYACCAADRSAAQHASADARGRCARRDRPSGPALRPVSGGGKHLESSNVNAALGQITAEFVGVFDADHDPAPHAFERAWRWLAIGYGVVQGHCVVRNGDASWVSRTVAVEFESIYAVAIPVGPDCTTSASTVDRMDTGAPTCCKVRMHGFMLTEDIDSSLRVIEAGGKIASDPARVSRELAGHLPDGLVGQADAVR